MQLFLRILILCLGALPTGLHAQFELNAEPQTDVVLAHPFPEETEKGKTGFLEFAKRIYMEGELPSLRLFANRFGGVGADTLLFWKSQTVQNTLNIAIGAPDAGVFTFDGLNAAGQPYRNVLANGRTDSLVSHLIVLDPDSLYPNSAGAPRAISLADSLYLCFYYQPGGRGDFPEVTDSLTVFFRDSTSGHVNWVRMWGVSTKDLAENELQPDQFYFANVPIANERFLHNNFQFKLQTNGSQNGMFDLWHVDHIMLRTNGRATDTRVIEDVGASTLTQRTRGHYTQLPPKATQTDLPQAPISFGITNTGMLPATVGASIGIIRQNPLLSINSPMREVVLAPFLYDTIQVLLPQSIPFPQASTLLHAGVFTITAAQDEISTNNQFIHILAIDSILAIDDGEADSGFGLNTTFNQQFGQKFVLPAPPDTLTAVWMNFLPRFNVPTLKAFELMIWDATENSPSAVLYNQIANADQGTTYNHQHRIVLNQPLLLTDSVIVGLRQFDNIPINLGVDFDYDYNQGQNIVYDNFGSWAAAPFAGTLMIRLEFNGKAQFANRGKAHTHQPAFRIYPNPSVHGQLSIGQLDAKVIILQPLTVSVHDLSGKLLREQTFLQPSFPITLSAAQSLPAGSYQVQVRVGQSPPQVYKWIRL